MTDSDWAYNQALDYLYSFVDYSLKHVSELAQADFNLDRMAALLKQLGDPHRAYPTIHIAGTKGKGSVGAMCASILSAAGYQAGLYTSPHLQEFTERMQINGVQISRGELAGLVEEIKPAVAGVPYLTTFEITTALGFLYFARRMVDVAVIEVGLGGRLDATNVVTPLAAVITSLSLDHTAVLGDTLDKIAAEKGGIIKEGVPVISAPQEPVALEILERIANERHAPLTVVGREITYEIIHQDLGGQKFIVSGPFSTLEAGISLLGAYQVKNAAVAAAAVWAARGKGLRVTDAHIQKGLSDTRWPARFEVVRREPPVILDSAHNQDSFARMHETLDVFFPSRPLILVFGASEDKDLIHMLSELKPRIRTLIATRADHPRALAPERILAAARQAGIACEQVEPVEKALHRALKLSQKDGSIVLSAGSMFVTAEVMTAWQELNFHKDFQQKSRKKSKNA
ncbi:MAG: bifunctional folylpolyglutamate synthase/dihydrofolate synthase [Anaerolineales bacterium]|nr:bifunctional folylpolyglutamate synthase/dihydrofolate synthase [Anaerolineales bacterium]